MNALPSGPLTSALSAERPFPGLRPFGPSDHGYFFGRKAQFYALYRLLDQSRFVAVVGSSGSGKSSLVRGGLLPLLREESRDSGGRTWFWQEMRPGNAPLDELAAALKRLGNSVSEGDDQFVRAGREARIAHNLESDYGISRCIADLDGLKDASIVLVVDQFEELFRSIGPAGSRRDPRDESRLRDDAVRFVQLLLEASRSPDHDIRILITMRSDFIGDCSRFQSLPEAVSTAQFLVPSLTRDQREQIIRGPIREAKGSIDAALVERLLNDSNDELDQLPVLQHCLFRLWDRTSPGNRHMTLDDYQAVGGVAHALSQHANEILETLPVPEFAVEQTFRTLSELHDEGRITRRVCSFEQLVSESGVAEDDLRKVINRLQADDCSFLAPVPRIAPAARIDVGHEALLRRWERVSGEANATGETGDQRAVGWLRQEAKDGQIYRALLSFSEGDTIRGDLFERRWKWWNRPEGVRTAAWADRYGGGYDQVVRLLKDSEAEVRADEQHRNAAIERERKNVQLTKVAAVVAFGLFVAASAAAIWAYKANSEAQKANADAQNSLNIALNQTEKLISSASESFNAGAMSATAARQLADFAEKTIDELRKYRQSPEIRAARIKASITISDIYEALGDRDKSLASARLAKSLARQLVNDKIPDAPRYLYASLFREADILDEPGGANLTAVLQEYSQAKMIAQSLLKERPDNGQAEYDLAFVSNKVGETLQSQKKFDEAEKEYGEAFTHATLAAAKSTTNATWLALPGSTLTKIGNLQSERQPPNLDGAIKSFDDAMALQRELVESLAKAQVKSDVVSSNLGSSHRAKGRVLAKFQRFDESLAEYRSAFVTFKRLHDSDPGNSAWLSSAAITYSDYGDLLAAHQHLRPAQCARESEKQIRQMLVDRYPDNSNWQRNLRRAEAKLDVAIAAVNAAAPVLADGCPDWRFGLWVVRSSSQ